MRLDDRIRVRHMVEAAQTALRLCAGMDREAFIADERTYRAVFQCIEVIGEAANHVQPATRGQMPGVPWPKLVGMRNILVHVYFDIDVPLVWEVVVKDLDPLVRALGEWEKSRP